jgi:hypothetical protein
MYRLGAVAATIGIGLVLLTGETLAQQPGPVAAMFRSDQQRDPSLAGSFLPVILPATPTAAFPLQVYLSAGDLERAFDRPEFRPDAAIIPTNTDIHITAPAPETQRVLIDRVKQEPDVMRDLENQIATRRKQSPPATGAEPGLLRIGADAFVVQLVRAGNAQSHGSLPKAASWLPPISPTAVPSIVGNCSRRTAFGAASPRVSTHSTRAARTRWCCR